MVDKGTITNRQWITVTKDGTASRTQSLGAVVMSGGGGARMPPLDEWDPRRGRTGRPWRRLVARHCPPGSICAWCNEEIQFGLRPRHPLGPSLDHIIALIDGGHPTAPWNLQPMHLGCNVRKENERRRKEKASVQPVGRPRTKLRPH